MNIAGGFDPVDMAALYARTEIGDGGCLLWTLSCNCGGRNPQMRLRGRTVSVRRVIAEWRGMPLDSKRIRVSCDDQKCVAWQHFLLVDQAEIAAHNSRTGRLSLPKRRESARRARRRASSLTPTDVRTIYASSEPIRVLAERYGKSRALIRRIKLREVWADVIVTDVTRPNPRAAAPDGQAYFSAQGIGHYMPADSAISRAYGCSR